MLLLVVVFKKVSVVRKHALLDLKARNECLRSIPPLPSPCAPQAAAQGPVPGVPELSPRLFCKMKCTLKEGQA